MALIVGMFFHLLLDGMWMKTGVFLWPFFGSIPPGPRPYWSDVFSRALADPWRWVREFIGLAYLASVWVQSGLNDPTRRRRLLDSGRLESLS